MVPPGGRSRCGSLRVAAGAGTEPAGAYDQLRRLGHVVADKGEHAGQQGADDLGGRTAQREALVDRLAEPARVDERGDRRRAHVDDGRGAHPGDDDGRGQRQLDAPQHGERAHPHAPRRLDHRGVDLGQPDHRVPEHGQERVEHERRDRGPEADLPERDGDEHEHAERGHRLRGVGQADDDRRGAAQARAGREHPEGQGERDHEHRGHGDQLEVPAHLRPQHPGIEQAGLDAVELGGLHPDPRRDHDEGQHERQRAPAQERARPPAPRGRPGGRDPRRRRLDRLHGRLGGHDAPRRPRAGWPSWSPGPGPSPPALRSRAAARIASAAAMITLMSTVPR